MLSLTGSTEEVLRFSAQNDDVACLDISGRKRISVETAKKIIRETLDVQSRTQFQNMDRKARGEVLHQLKKKGLSVRQIERLTGINRSVELKA